MIHEPKFLAMAEVLGELGMEIEALGEVLCRDENFAERHVRELQAIDLIAQKQRALAAILAAGFSETEMRRISLEALRSRFCGFIDDAGISCCEVPIEDSGTPDSLGLWD
ncbi:hypothetical protein SAMN05518801_11266 [Novosphingobium sp. CF614]|uniref:hypothetical protein n=1 Tax=Novosphingobium sp. CF614 TaxID=1884364 RepID=UPI0008E1CD09|nr:hypothetical protein [Novosphingobium sp. CF614]SFG25501.1 hypothetical protein SAMN05518801_11266 [Novosphingobium sp. CF614]